MEYLESQVGDRPELFDKVVPNFPPYGKRMIVDNGWYQALRRDNVRLETSPIVEDHRERGDDHRRPRRPRRDRVRHRLQGRQGAVADPGDGA